MRKIFKANRRAWIDFTLTLVGLGVAFVLASLSPLISRTGDWAVGAFSALASLVLALGCGLYIVPRLARRVRVEMWGFGIRTSITTEGYLFLLVAVVVGVAAWNTENNLLYLILAVVLAFIIVSGNVARLMLYDVAVQLRFPDNIVAGEPVNLAVTLVNRKRLLPSCSVGVESNARRAGLPPLTARERKRKRPDSARLAHFIVVPPRSSVRQLVEHVFERRGIYAIENFTLSTKFPAGFFRKWRDVAAEGKIVVFPPERPVDDFFHSLPIVAGATSSHIRGDGLDLFAFRDYQSTDHIRRIDWKASARAQRFVVRETVSEEDFHLSIFFDPRRPDRDDEPEAFAERFERGVEMAASLARHFISEGADVEVATPDARVEPGAGSGHLYRLLTVFAGVESARPGDDTATRFSWDLLDVLPGLADEHRFKVLFTSAPKGTIPASIWRSAHVVYIEDL
jgi:uncharacterized protein (DUF58 family)